MAAGAAAIDLDTKIAAVERMRKGGTLLKAGRAGKPHFRRFQLSQDLTQLQWASPKKKTNESAVNISEVTEILYGQTTKVFQGNPVPNHEAVSFSLIYATRSLDIVCKDKKEFETWTIGLQALLAGEMKVSMFSGVADGSDEETLDIQIKGRNAVLVTTENASDLYTWGHGGYGRLGHGDLEDKGNPQVLEALLGNDVRSISCGALHTAVLSPTGEVFTWGCGSGGRLGQGHERNRVTPLVIGALRGIKIVEIACGFSHTLCLSDQGEVFSFGKGNLGQLGYSSEKQLLPRKVEGLTEIVDIGAGTNYSAAVSETGDVFTWGANDRGQLGQSGPSGVAESATTCDTPTRVETLSRADVRVVQVSLGATHALARTDVGRVYAWGDNRSGRLGMVVDEPQLPFHIASLADDVEWVSAGGSHSACIRRGGSCWTWGAGGEGQLGNPERGISSADPAPVIVAADVCFASVECGGNFCVALTKANRAYVWGEVSPSMTCSGIPTPVDAMADKSVRAIAAGENHVASTVTHDWVPDDEAVACMACKAVFTFVRRKHHCRNCGGLFCGNCTSKKWALLSKGFSDPVRVCDKCYTIVSK